MGGAGSAVEERSSSARGLCSTSHEVENQLYDTRKRRSEAKRAKVEAMSAFDAFDGPLR